MDNNNKPENCIKPGFHHVEILKVWDNNIIDNRTKGEWSIYESTNHIFILLGKSGFCELGVKTETNKANAAFICKAVNNYDMLLTALKDIFQYDQENTWVGRTALKAIKKVEQS